MEIDRAVGARLKRVRGIVEVPTPALELFILRDFLDRPRCEAFARMVEADRKPSRLLADNPDAQFRTSETCNLDPRSALVRALDARISDLTGLDLDHGEYIQGQRYGVGQQFKPHHDYFRTDAPYWPRQERIGGQRTWTVMIFLNQPESGGETHFPHADVTIPPRQGSLVAWNNLEPDGAPNRRTLHQGRPVLAGVKYILTKWFRERRRG